MHSSAEYSGLVMRVFCLADESGEGWQCPGVSSGEHCGVSFLRWRSGMFILAAMYFGDAVKRQRCYHIPSVP